MNPINNPETEEWCNLAARLWYRTELLQSYWVEFVLSHPGLKQWEQSAIIDRVRYLATGTQAKQFSEPLEN